MPKPTLQVTTLHNCHIKELFNPCDLYKVYMPQELLESQKNKAIKQGLLPETSADFGTSLT